MDNGKIRMQQYNQAMIVEVYSSDEITMADIDWVIETLRICSAPPFDVILVKSGSYFLSDAAKTRLLDDEHISKVAYVVRKLLSTQYAVRASKTYLRGKQVYICDSIQSAYWALTGSSEITKTGTE